MRGKVVLVDFWGTWCGPCRAAIPELNRLYAKYKDRDLEIVGVHTTQNAERMAEFVRQEKIQWPVASDVENRTVQAWHVTRYPSVYLIDRSGKLRVASVFKPYLEKTIEQLLAEEIGN